MNLNDLLLSKHLDPNKIIVIRHKPCESKLSKVFPWLAAVKPAVFNAYQQTQTEKLERVMKTMIGNGYLASFIGHQPGKAVFIGMYSIGKSKIIPRSKYWKIPGYEELRKFGMVGLRAEDPRSSILFFDLRLTDFYNHWKGKLIIDWPAPERSWWRRAHRNEFPVIAVLEESMLDAVLPEWNKIILTWEEIKILPSSWKAALSQWRGIYFIFDASDRKGYVGSAYGRDNILGRWLRYSETGHGGNRLLRSRNPQNFQFSILQRVSPDMETEDIIRLEDSWKERLHTRHPLGLNDN